MIDIHSHIIPGVDDGFLQAAVMTPPTHSPKKKKKKKQGQG